MLTLVEKIVFLIAAAASGYAAYLAAVRIIKIIHRGNGKPDLKLARQRLVAVLIKVASMQPTFKIRLGSSLLHAFIAWGFIYYLLVNFGDVLEGFLPNFQFLGDHWIGGIYRLLGDLLSVAVLVGMLAMLFRRFVLKDKQLSAREDVLLHPHARGHPARLCDRGDLYPLPRWRAFHR